MQSCRKKKKKKEDEKCLSWKCLIIMLVFPHVTYNAMRLDGKKWNFFDKVLPYGVIKIIKKNAAGRQSLSDYDDVAFVWWGKMYSQSYRGTNKRHTIMQFSWCVHVPSRGEKREKGIESEKNGSSWRVHSSLIFSHWIFSTGWDSMKEFLYVYFSFFYVYIESLHRRCHSWTHTHKYI